MNNRVLLINTADLRAFTDIGVNYNAQDLSNAVLKAQERDLSDIIGKNLLEHYQEEIAASRSLTGHYLTLLDDYIKPYLIHASYAYVLDTLYLRPRSNGLSQRTPSPGYTPASRQLYHEKRNYTESDIKFHGDRIVEYLQQNFSEFSELRATTEIPSDAPELDKQTNGNILLIDKSSRKYKRNRNRNINRYGN